MADLLSEDASHLTFAAGGTFALANGKLEEPEYSSTNWYFSRDEIENNSPSRKDGVDVKKETYFRKSYCTFLQDLGMRLRVPQVTIATAIVLCHRFFLRQSHARNDKFMVATVCMFLAGKVEETPRPLRDVIILSYELRNKKDPAAVQRIKQKDVFEDQKELVLLGERLLLTTLEFDMNIHHPYKPLVTAIKRFKVAQNALAQVAWNFVNDGLRTSLCLQFKPHHIAAGAIFLATKFLKVKLPSAGDNVWWHEFEVTAQQLEEVSNQMLELYEQNKAGPSSRASDPSVSAGACNGYKTEIASHGHPEGPISGNGFSQSSHVDSFTVTHDHNAEAAVPTSQREVNFHSRDSSKGYLHGGLEGRKQGVYADFSEEDHAKKGGTPPNFQEPVHFSHSRTDTHIMNGFPKLSTAGQELREETTGHGHHVEDSVGIKESSNSRNGTHMFPVAAAPKLKYTRPESREDLLVGQDEIHGQRKHSEEKELLMGHLKEDAKRPAGVKSKLRKENEGRQRPLVNAQELKNDTVKDSTERKRKSKFSGGEKFIRVKQEVNNGNEIVSRGLENAVEVTTREGLLKQDPAERRRRDVTSSSEISNDHEGELWSTIKHKKSTNAGQPHLNTKGQKAFEKGNLHSTNLQTVKLSEGAADQIEEGEFGAQLQNHFPKVLGGRHLSPDGIGKARQHPGTREGSYDNKHWHGNNQSSLNSGYHQDLQKADQDINRHWHKDQAWQERDSKKVRHDHVK
ncbi:hypothetical protein O6H91_09G060800 [Diphasiastrum complanatum]|uniref:Uncharacterized protein n=2 Tax=Diphasiastrum complanatum TaxID=34168 RepID=A0ACC2CPQ1_DIPCM|nr:hypothetical protein O6H91_09G060800 [Diphasiastrum complanatum]